MTYLDKKILSYDPCLPKINELSVVYLNFLQSNLQKFVTIHNIYSRSLFSFFCLAFVLSLNCFSAIRLKMYKKTNSTGLKIDNLDNSDQAQHLMKILANYETAKNFANKFY